MKRNNLNRVMLADALHNCTVRSGASDDYCRGLIVGIVSALMASGLSFEDALAEVKERMPRADLRSGRLFPESWTME